MTEVVVNHFQFDGVPQSLPRAREDSINEPVPQLRKRGLDRLTHLREQKLMLRRIGSGQQQHLGFFRQQLGCRLAVRAISACWDGDGAAVRDRQAERPAA